jgi:hypothetical protein
MIKDQFLSVPAEAERFDYNLHLKYSYIRNN